MGDCEDFDLDRSRARAWDSFRARLADHIAEMEDHEKLVVDAESAVDEDDDAGTAPYIQFCGWGGESVRCEVSSNTYLAEAHRLDDRACERLTGLGWSEPTRGSGEADAGRGSPNFSVELERRDADRLAVMTVTAFQDVFGVPHPAFLTAHVLDGRGGTFDPVDTPSPAPTTESGPDEPLAVMPGDRAHLRALVDAALTPVFGRVPKHDRDDDIAVSHGSAIVYVRVDEETPVVILFAVVAGDVSDRKRAAFEVSLLNWQNRMLKFQLVEDQVVASTCVLGAPFAPEHLRAVLGMMVETLDEVDDNLVARVGGRRAIELADDEEDDEEYYVEDGDQDDEVDEDDEDEEDEVAPVHPAMLTILELNAEEPDSVTPELAASICDMDSTLILELIAWNEQRHLASRGERVEATDSGEARVADQGARGAEQTLALLRRALRVVVERRLAKDHQAYAEPAGPAKQWRVGAWRRADGPDETCE